MTEQQYRSALIKKRIPIFILMGITLITSILGFIAHIPVRFMLNAKAVLVDREYYRLVTSMFLHADVVHLAQNMICFYGVSDIYLSFRRWYKFVPVYLVSGILGGFFESLIRFHMNDLTYSLGASGAVMGVLGADIAVVIKTNRGRSSKELTSLLVRMGILALINLVPGRNGTDYLGHLLGFVTGFLLGLIL